MDDLIEFLIDVFGETVAEGLGEMIGRHWRGLLMFLAGTAAAAGIVWGLGHLLAWW